MPAKDSRRLVKTSVPGIFKRVKVDPETGKQTTQDYAVIYRAFDPNPPTGSPRVRQFKQYAQTWDAAKRVRGDRTGNGKGEIQPSSQITLHAYLAEWIDSYQGTGRRGFRENTRDEYRRLLHTFALRYFPASLRLTDVTPRGLQQFVSWLDNPEAQGKRVADDKRRAEAKRRDVAPSQVPKVDVEPVQLADTTIRNAVVPVRAALATARREDLIRHNPADRLALPARQRIEEDDEEDVKALSRDQLAALLVMAPERYRLLVELIASTGLRISEAIGLQRRHLALDGANPHVKVRRAIVKRKVEPPKSRHGKRNVPISAALVSKLRAHLDDVPEGSAALVFPSGAGTPLDPDNMRSRMLKPLMEEIGAPWAGWHTLRHTYASIQLAGGANIVALSRALGHHSAAFTLEVYVHLLEGDEAPALDLGAVLETGQRRGNASHGNQTHSMGADTAQTTTLSEI